MRRTSNQTCRELVEGEEKREREALKEEGEMVFELGGKREEKEETMHFSLQRKQTRDHAKAM